MIEPSDRHRDFVKMHGAGNDFVVVDGRRAPCRPSRREVTWICDRNIGVGGDQLLVIEPPTRADCDARMRIYNIDGMEAQTCLNATRCVAWLLLRERGAARITLETRGGPIACSAAGPYEIALDIAAPRWDWRDVPLAKAADTLALDIESGPLKAPTALNLGNPHLVCFVPERDVINAPRWAPALQEHPLLPEGANIGIAEMVAPDRIHLVVWERPGILTQACGSGACAAVAAARRRGLTDARRITVDMPGGLLRVEAHEDGRMTLSGPVAVAFTGRFPTERGAA